MRFTLPRRLHKGGCQSRCLFLTPSHPRVGQACWQLYRGKISLGEQFVALAVTPSRGVGRGVGRGVKSPPALYLLIKLTPLFPW